jgi:hypothetical protein
VRFSRTQRLVIRETEAPSMSRVRRRQRPSASRRALIWDDPGVRCVRFSVKRCDFLMADRAGGFTHLRGRTGRSPTSELQSSTTLSRGIRRAFTLRPCQRQVIGTWCSKEGGCDRTASLLAGPRPRHATGAHIRREKSNAARSVLQIAGETGETSLIFELFAVSNPPVAGGVICESITPVTDWMRGRYGSSGRIRTYNPPVNSRMLYH